VIGAKSGQEKNSPICPHQQQYSPIYLQRLRVAPQPQATHNQGDINASVASGEIDWKNQDIEEQQG
jgi:hypothetical protein